MKASAFLDLVAGETALDLAKAAGNPDCGKLEQGALVISMRKRLVLKR